MIKSQNINKLAWVLSAAIVAAATALYLNLTSKGGVPTFGDWGDFIGCFGTLTILVWLAAGHCQNQKEMLEIKRELSEQTKLTQEVVGALMQLASNAKAQATDVLIEAHPRYQETALLTENTVSQDKNQPAE